MCMAMMVIFSAETAGIEKREVLCALGEMNPSVRGTFITPNKLPSISMLASFVYG